MAQQIQLRNDNTAAWAESNPILAQGEIGIDTTLDKFKIGDGTSTWTQLAFATSGNVADFEFIDDGGDGSFMTVTDHDMTIRTLRDEDNEDSDCDINIEAADDVFIRAYGDDVNISAKDEVTIISNSNDTNSDKEWTFNRSGYIEFPDGTVQTTSAQGILPLPYFLTWEEGKAQLPDLNTHFGWNSQGLWFQNAQGSSPTTSYPIYTDFTIPQNSSVVVEFIFDANTECNNIGVCVYSDNDSPAWDYATNSSRIAAQFDCFDLKLFGRNTSEIGNVGLPESGLYRVRFAYDPTASTDKVTVSYTAQGSDEIIESLSINEALPTGPYRIGFAADQDSDTTKTYMTYLSINVNDGDDIYGADLDNGNSGTTSDADLVLPVAIKDDSGEDFITFTRTGTGTARIATPQDDLSLRSARDITLFAGNEGPGNVYIGWGDAELTPDASNRVATIGDIQSLTTGDFEFNDSTMSTEDVTMKIEAKRNASTQGAAIELRPYDGQVSLYGYGSTLGSNYTTDNWTGDATWSSDGQGGSQVVLTGATFLFTFLDETFNQAPIRFVSINGSDDYEFTGFSGNSGNFTITTQTGAPLESTTVTSLVFSYRYRSVIEVNDDDEEILIEGKGLDVNLKSTEDISFTSNLLGGTEHNWQMSTDGQFRLPGDGYIENVVNGSSDGNGGDTLKIVPDSTLGTDQHIIIDPTMAPSGPNHIHIRAGGTIDESAVNLILGGEKNAVIVSDDERAVGITTRAPRVSQALINIQTVDSAQFVTNIPDPEGVLVQPDWKVLHSGDEYTVTAVSLNTPTEGLVTITATGLTFGNGTEYTFYYDEPFLNTWTFTSDGTLSGPIMGGLKVPGIVNTGIGNDLYIAANDANIQMLATNHVRLDASNGEIYLNPDGWIYVGTEVDAENAVVIRSDLSAYQVRGTVPTSSLGQAGDTVNSVASNSTHFYFCHAPYDGTTHIWKRIAWSADTWGV